MSIMASAKLAFAYNIQLYNEFLLLLSIHY